LIIASIKPLFKLKQEHIDELFLENVHDDTMRSLTLSMGADINAKREDGSNCLWHVIQPTLLSELINKGAHVKIIDNKKRTVLDTLAEDQWLRNSTIDEKIISVKMLFNAGAIATKNNDLLGNILWQCDRDEIALQAVEFFLTRNIDINAPTSNKNTLLMIATTKNYINTVELLLKEKADPNITGYWEDYPLHMAIGKPYSSSFKPDIILLLLKYKANPNVTHYRWSISPLSAVLSLRKKANKEDRAIYDKVVKTLKKSGAQ
jgi:hypothetical protein